MGERRQMTTLSREKRLAAVVAALEERVAALEAEVARLKEETNSQAVLAETAWWKQIVGAFENDPEFDEAMCLSREYRESLRPKGDDTAVGAA
jgi:uncharacterized small protein (DUF1192 family)